MLVWRELNDQHLLSIFATSNSDINPIGTDVWSINLRLGKQHSASKDS